jgi:glucokinase
LDTFCAMLGTVAADVALTLGARGGVYIGGGIIPKLGDYFATSPFRSRFEEKGRFSSYLANIPTWVIHAPWPGLIGAATSLDDDARSLVR